ncbi:MAG: DNA translocase FtsK [Candidatus Dojkabacteria bacterium]|jgi:S-DNA-T family DNA segregation ATPase FtsK/SpoIIIE|nr:DNA translocase FtsK [Candidatus Dojkabacteria bacterium]MDD4560932.1 DNA translocase FtsK [Candidatus Dojkabacteria bacterium]
MPRKKKKEPLTIKSGETKIVLGLILFLTGLIVLLSPFLLEQSPLFDQVALLLGYAAIAWGILFLYISFSFLTKSKKFVSLKQGIGLFLLALCLNILLSFWLIEEQLGDRDALKAAGGELGKLFHLSLNNWFGSFIELILVLILLIISFSLITGTTLEQIRDFVESSVPEKEKRESGFFDVKSFFKKIKSDDDIKIETGESDIGKVEIMKGEISDESDQIPNKGEDEEEDEVQIHTPVTPVVHSDDNVEEGKPEGPKYTDWVLPSIELLQEGKTQKQDEKLYRSKALVIQQTLRSFGIQAKVVQVSVGPTVLRFSLSVSVGVKVSRIKNLSNDLALALASQTSSVRIEAPIPGTSFVGVEIPNPTPNFVYIRDMIGKLKKDNGKYELPLILGKDITAKTCIADLAKIPHLLVAGATGTGKSVAINSLLTGILMSKTPDEVKFIMIDPKMGVEMAIYNGIPHLLNPVITDTEAVINALQWCIEEMMRRYRQLKQVKAKKLTEYNKRIGYLAMPYIIIVIDEMADLILTSGIDVETKIQRLAQMGRAVGIHLILATQKPTVNVITGLIKSNIPGRMAFAVATNMDSRVILDESGAETLLGNGDMLYKDQTMPKPIRIQGTFTTTEDSEAVINTIKEQVKEEKVTYSEELADAIEKGGTEITTGNGGGRDPEFEKALAVVVSTQKASASFLQRKLRIGYNKAARIIDELHDAGAIGPQKGAKPRDVLVTSVEQLSQSQKDDVEG